MKAPRGAVEGSSGGGTGSFIADRSLFGSFKHEEVTRVILQTLQETGYRSVAKKLELRSGCRLSGAKVESLRVAITDGQWDDLEEVLKDIALEHESDRHDMLFEVRRQRYLESLVSSKPFEALTILQGKLSPLLHTSQRARLGMRRLSSALFINKEDIYESMGWAKSIKDSRKDLTELLQSYLSTDLLLHPGRLAKIFTEVKQGRLDLDNNVNAFDTGLCQDEPRVLSQFQLQQSLEGHGDEVWCIEFSPDGRKLASGCKNSMIRIWNHDEDLGWRFHLSLTDHTEGIVSMSWSPDSKRLLSAGNDRHIMVWDAESGKLLYESVAHEDVVTGCSWLPNGEGFITSSPDMQLILWSNSFDIIKVWRDHRIMGLAITPDSRLLVAHCHDSFIRVYDLQNQTIIGSLFFDMLLTSVSISKDSKYALIASEDQYLVELSTLRIVNKYTGACQSEYYIRSTFGGSRDQLIIAGSEDNEALIWNRYSGEIITTLKGHVGVVNSVRWCPGDEGSAGIIATASDDSTIIIWAPTKS